MTSEMIRFNTITKYLERPTLLLKTRTGEFIANIPYTNFQFSFVGNGLDEISFEVHKYTNGKKFEFWDKLTDLAIIDYLGYGLFEATFDVDDKDETIKTGTAVSLETELGQRTLREFHVNDEEAITLDSNYSPTVLCNMEDTKHSLLHRVISDKATHWSIGYVSPYFNISGKICEPNTIERVFTVDGTSIYDFLTGEVADEINAVFTFDTYNRKINCYNIEECVYNAETKEVLKGWTSFFDVKTQRMLIYDENGNEPVDSSGRKIIDVDPYKYQVCDGIGEDTGVFISKNKIANNFQINYDKDGIKNCFYVSGGDDIITNAVAAVNATGNNYIYLFDNFQYEDMGTELSNKIKDYQSYLSTKQKEFYAPGGVYVLEDNSDSSIVYDETTKSCRKNGIIMPDTIYRNGKFYTLNPYCYSKNGIVYDENDNQMQSSQYIYEGDGGLYTYYSHSVDRKNYVEHSKFPDTAISDTTASDEFKKVTDYFNIQTNYVLITSSCSSDSFANVTNTIKAQIGIIADSRYTVKMLSGVDYPQTCSTLTADDPTGIWTGYISLVRTADSTDTYIGNITVNVKKVNVESSDNVAWCNQKLQFAIANLDIANIELPKNATDDELRTFFKQYNMNSLKSFTEAYSSCVATLDELYTQTKETCSDIPNTLRPQYQKYANISKEIYEQRKKQVDELDSIIEKIEEISLPDFRKSLDLKNYLGDILYTQFQAYVREDDYNNDNYISDALSDSGVLVKAKELLDFATEELKKACCRQYSISGNLNNIFAVDELKALHDKFDIFNYIRVEIDEKIYKLRLVQIDFNETSPEELNVTFSETIESIDRCISDTQSMKQQVSSIASSYTSTMKQSKQGASASSMFTQMKNEGLNSADYVIKNSTNEEVIIDNTGVNAKSEGDIGFYGDHQARLTGNGLYLTEDAWASSPKAAVGWVKINNKWQYGVVTDAIVGNLVATDTLVISNDKENVTIDKDGIVITGGKIDIKNSGNGKSVLINPQSNDDTDTFCITNKNGTKTLWADSEGNVYVQTTKSQDSVTSGEIISLDEDSGKTVKLANGKAEFGITNNTNTTSTFIQYGFIGMSYWADWFEDENDSLGISFNTYEDSGDNFVSFGRYASDYYHTYSPTMIFNYGLNPNGYTEKIIMKDDVRITQDLIVMGKITATPYTSTFGQIVVNNTIDVDARGTFGQVFVNDIVNVTGDATFAKNISAASIDVTKTGAFEKISVNDSINVGVKGTFKDISVTNNIDVSNGKGTFNEISVNYSFDASSGTCILGYVRPKSNTDVITFYGDINAVNNSISVKDLSIGGININKTYGDLTGDSLMFGAPIWVPGKIMLDEDGDGGFYQVATQNWVFDNFSPISSDARVKTDFSLLPKNIDSIFHQFLPQQYRYNNIKGRDGFYFGDTSQHIIEVFKNNGLDINDYSIVRQRDVSRYNGEDKFIDPETDKFYYINQENIIWLCVDQIQKQKKRADELEARLKALENK